MSSNDSQSSSQIKTQVVTNLFKYIQTQTEFLPNLDPSKAAEVLDNITRASNSLKLLGAV